MTQYTLTLLDTTGIQDYIFSSNRLQENIGASELVYRATTLWVFEALKETVGKAHNIINGESPHWTFDESKHIENEKDGLKAEVIQAAGGNTILLFRESPASREFVKKLTFRILRDAPGLTLLAQHNDEFEFGLNTSNLPAAISVLSREGMKAHKLSRRGSTPLRGLGVTAVCDSTGLPAVATLGEKRNGQPLGLRGEDESSLISAESTAKRIQRQYANKRLEFLLADAVDDFTFPYNLDKIGRLKGEESYVAVIHADGNRMGKRIEKLGEKAQDDRQYIQDLRAFSKKINDISLSALQSAVGLVVQAVKNEAIPFVMDKDEDGEEITRKYLPFRPLVFGGDDVTFVCNGQIGVSLAVAYIKAFEKAAEQAGENDFHASAGVSIVKMHYPFARAYKLAEELTASAKGKVKELFPKKEEEYTEGEPRDCSAIDWHFAQSGLSGSLKNIRAREYHSDDGKPIYLRPLPLDVGEINWEKVQSVIAKFKGEWADKHNKAIGLREPLRKGASASEAYIHDFDLFTDKVKLPEIAGEMAQKTGWAGDTCYYFDAIELLDHYVSLEREEASS
jgi:hypothetical protein